MAKLYNSLSATDVESAVATGRCYHLNDGGGLWLKVSPLGSKAWSFSYTFAGKSRTKGLGVYPKVSLNDARLKRDQAVSLLKGAPNPLARKAAPNDAVGSERPTLAQVADEWLTIAGTRWTTGYAVTQRRFLDLHVLPWLGTKAIASLRSSDFKPIFDRLLNAGLMSTATRIRQQVSAIFLFASIDQRVDRDPVVAFRLFLPRVAQKNHAFIVDPKQVGELLHRIDRIAGSFPVLCALRLLPLLFVRPGQLRAAQWSEINLATAQWLVPRARRKLRTRLREDTKVPPLWVPLSQQAVAILRELQPLTGTSQFLFTVSRDQARPITDAALRYGLMRAGYEGDIMTLHGFRHLASTTLHEMGFRPDHIEAQLDHTAQGVRATYNKAQYLDQRRRMMQAWADHLDRLKNDFARSCRA